MLLLLFKVGDRHYGIPAGDIVQVLPSTVLQRSDSGLEANSVGRTAGWQTAQVGLLRWQTGKQMEWVPVMDLSQVLMGVACPKTIGTRIMLVQDETDRLWGFMASAMVQTWTLADDQWKASPKNSIPANSIPNNSIPNNSIPNNAIAHPSPQGITPSIIPQTLMRDQTLIYGLSVDQLLTQVRQPCDQFRLRTLAMERDRTASQNAHRISV